MFPDLSSEKTTTETLIVGVAPQKTYVLFCSIIMLLYSLNFLLLWTNPNVVVVINLDYADTLRDLRWAQELRMEAASADPTAPVTLAIVNERDPSLRSRDDLVFGS